VTLYILSGTIYAGYNGSLSITCTSGCTTAAAISTPPAGSLQLATVTVTAGATGTVTNEAPILTRSVYTAGTGLTGTTTFAVDTSAVPMFGATPGISGCSSATIVGNMLYGVITAGGVSCNAVLTFGFTAPTGWSCAINNRTHTGTTNLVQQTADSATTATFAGTTVASDKLNYICGPY
jgi:hypothetical protein